MEEPRLVQLFAEPIVKQLMRCDGIDEATRYLNMEHLKEHKKEALRALAA